MPIALKEGFYQTHDLAHVGCLGIESDRITECIDRIRDKHILGVFGSPSFGFKGSDLSFLREMRWLEAVWFWDVALDNIDGLYSLENLRHFGVHPKRPPIDFSRFPKLRKVIVEPKAKDRGLDVLRELELLHIWHYRSTDSTFSALSLPMSLLELQINWANPTSLESLPALPHLRRLEIHRCRNLEHLGRLNEKYPNLEHLVVLTSGKVTPDEGRRSIQGLHKLSHAFVGNTKLI